MPTVRVTFIHLNLGRLPKFENSVILLKNALFLLLRMNEKILVARPCCNAEVNRMCYLQRAPFENDEMQ